MFHKFFVPLPTLKSSKCISMLKDTAKVKYTDNCNVNRFWEHMYEFRDTGQSLLPSRRTFTGQRGTMQTAPTTSGCPLEPQTSNTLISASSYLYTPEDQILAAFTIKGGVRSHLVFFSSA